MPVVLDPDAAAVYKAFQEAVAQYRWRYRYLCVTSIKQVVVDISGEPYENLERDLALAFAKD